MQTTEEYRREQMTKRTDDELREIVSMECVVPLDYQLAQMALGELSKRGTVPDGSVTPSHE